MSSILRQIPQEVFDFFRYDPENGKVYWKKRSGQKGVPGKEAGHTNRAGYIEIRFKKTTYKGHRLAWALYYKNTKTPQALDHINGERSDNRIQNLRPATAPENARNRKKGTGRTSRYKGVSWYNRKSKWQAQIKSNCKSLHLGYFCSEYEAHLAYCEAAIRLHGEFANLG